MHYYDKWLLDGAEKHLNQEEYVVAYDWCEEPIFSDEREKFINIEGELVLDDPKEVYHYIKETYDTHSVDELETIL